MTWDKTTCGFCSRVLGPNEIEICDDDDACDAQMASGERSRPEFPAIHRRRAEFRASLKGDSLA